MEKMATVMLFVSLALLFLIIVGFSAFLVSAVLAGAVT